MVGHDLKKKEKLATKKIRTRTQISKCFTTISDLSHGQLQILFVFHESKLNRIVTILTMQLILKI